MSQELYSKEEQLTIDSYNRASIQWSHQRTRAAVDFPKKLKKHLPFGKIIEFGCGDGWDAKNLIEKGYDYIGTDVSIELVKLTQQNVPNGKFIQSSVYQLPFDKNTFDGFWANAVFLHIPKKKMNEAFTEIRRVCKEGAIGFIMLKEGTGEKILKEDFDGIEVNRLFSFYQNDEFVKLLSQNGFEVIENGKEIRGATTWLHYFVKKI